MLASAVVVVATFGAFLPVLSAGFLNWDDNWTVVENPWVREPGAQTVRWAFSTFLMGHWQPLSWLSLALDARLWGLDPRGFHLTNLVLHLLASVGVLHLIAILLRRGAGAARLDGIGWSVATLATLWWSVHPMRVESVAWITERRDVLSGALLVLATLAWLTSCSPDRRPGRSLLALLLYAASLLAKASGATFFLVLLLLDLFPLRRWPATPAWRLLLEKTPFAVLGVAAAWIAPRAQAATGALVPMSVLDAADRLALAVHGWLFYLRQSLLPSRLTPLYELPTAVEWGALRFWGSAVGIGLVLALALLVACRRPALRAPAIVAVGLYTLLLLPVLGFFQSGPQLVADRYAYLPAIVLAAVLAAGLDLWSRGRTTRPRVWLGAATALVLALGSATFLYARAWQDSESLWRHALAVDSSCGYCREALATELLDQGRQQEAIEELRRVLAERPNLRKANLLLALALAERGDGEEALYFMSRALRLDPENPDLWRVQARIAQRAGRPAVAERSWLELLARRPEDRQASSELFGLLVEQGRCGEAAALLERDPRLPAEAGNRWQRRCGSTEG